MSYANDTLENLYRLWSRPVHVQTVLDDIVTVISYNGSDHNVEQREKVHSEQEEKVAS